MSTLNMALSSCRNSKSRNHLQTFLRLPVCVCLYDTSRSKIQQKDPKSCSLVAHTMPQCHEILITNLSKSNRIECSQVSILKCILVSEFRSLELCRTHSVYYSVIVFEVGKFPLPCRVHFSTSCFIVSCTTLTLHEDNYPRKQKNRTRTLV